jgi:N-carbamoylputrescine amidase
MTVVRVAMTETRNVFRDMPDSIDGLAALAGRLDEVRDANVAHHLALIEAASAAGVRVLGMGELFPGPYFALTEDPLWFGLAEDGRDGPTVRAMCEAAREHGMVLVAPIYEVDAASGKRFNTAVVIDAGGGVLGCYRKTHIPEGGNERASFHETFYYGPSDGGPDGYFPVFATVHARIGVAICYDRHFEGVVGSLAQGGAQIVFSPAVTFGTKSKRMWSLEFAVDAARHNVFIGGSNRRGAEPPWNIEFFGDSHFVGPDGRLAGLDVHPDLVVADLDLSRLEGPDDSGWDLARDVRPEIYR